MLVDCASLLPLAEVIGLCSANMLIVNTRHYLHISDYSGESDIVDIFNAASPTWSTAALSVARTTPAATSFHEMLGLLLLGSVKRVSVRKWSWLSLGLCLWPHLLL
jgi:hypothetical protein